MLRMSVLHKYDHTNPGLITSFSRLPYDVINFELDMLKDIGVKVETNRFMGMNDLTISKLTNEMGHKAVFVGIGNPEPKIIPIFKNLSEEQGFYTSKSFLPKVQQPVRPQINNSKTDAESLLTP